MKPPFKSAASVKAVTPSIVMYDPRFPHNVGAAVRAASCFDVHQVWITGKRTAEQVWKAKRIPREERMKGFNDVELILDDRPFDHFPRGTTPVAIELLPNAQSLLGFEHPENPVYVFGPEDGSVPAQVRGLCHHRVFIPTRHCVNLSSAVYLVLYDRAMKLHLGEPSDAGTVESVLAESRGWPNDDLPSFEAR